MRSDDDDYPDQGSSTISFQNFVTQDVFDKLAKNLEKDGYFVMDNVFGDRARELRGIHMTDIR